MEEYADVYLDSRRLPGPDDATRKLTKAGFQGALDSSYTIQLLQTVVAKRPEQDVEGEWVEKY